MPTAMHDPDVRSRGNGARVGWRVLKFGGTSVASRERWQSIAVRLRALHEGVGNTDERVLVVVSALGGVTNALQRSIDGVDDAADIGLVDSLRARHLALASGLELDGEALLDQRWKDLDTLVRVAAANRDLEWQAEMLAQGELLSSVLGAAFLIAQGLDIGWCDARAWLEARALPNQNAWAQRLSVACQSEADTDWRERFDAQPTRSLITQGFIARHVQGGTAILGRGGSDTSAAYFGAKLDARAVEIWTDVPGMFSANPVEVPDARLLRRLDYAEAQEIATTGARVLHPRAIGPCREAGVPILILDTARPHLPGTRIDGQAVTVPGVKAISRREGIVLVSMETIGMWQQVGFLADIFERFRQHGLSIDLIGSSETNVTVSLDPNENLVNSNVLEALATDLATVCRVKIIAPATSITLVGRGMRSLLHKLSGIWAMFGRERVHLISQSSNDLNLTFVIDSVAAVGMLPHLHAELVRSGAMPVQDADVFGASWKELLGVHRPRSAPWWRDDVPRLHALVAGRPQSTPCYVYHLPTLRTEARALRAVGAIDLPFYALKANPHVDVLRALAGEGFGFECVSLGEIEHLFRALPGFDPARVLFTPSFAPIAEYAAAFDFGVTVTLDNREALASHADVFRGRSIWLRLDLGRGEGHHEKVRTGGVAAKFGLPVAALDAFVADAAGVGVRITGLHAHLGSGVDTPGHWRGVYAELAALADGIGTVSTLDIGGGLPVAYKPDDEPFDLEAWSAGLAEIKAAYPRYALAIEPGRYLVATAGALLARVTQVVRKQGIARVGCDAGMHTLLRPALYEAWHDIANLTRWGDRDLAAFDVVGPICESGDVLGRQRSLPAATAPGDLLLVSHAGAYGAVMASRYNLRELPRELAIDDDVSGNAS